MQKKKCFALKQLKRRNRTGLGGSRARRTEACDAAVTRPCRAVTPAPYYVSRVNNFTVCKHSPQPAAARRAATERKHHHVA